MTEPADSVAPLRPFFEMRDGLYVPRGSARSPWNANHQNGVAIGSLLAHTMLEAGPPEDMNIARFTLDILRPAPMAATRAVWRPLRDGRRTHLLQGSLIVGEVEVARASALFVKRADDAPPAMVFDPPVPQPEDAPEVYQMPLATGLESRLIQRGAAASDQPLGRVWVRPLRRVVDGAAAHPLISAVLASDFGGGVSSGAGRKTWNSPNLDIAVHFLRPPRDEWILVEARTLLLGNGEALVDSRMSDRYGEFGRSHLTLFITPVIAPSRPLDAA